MRTKLTLLVVALVAAVGFAGYAFTASLQGTDEQAQENSLRTQQLCDYAHQQQADKRSDAIKSYKLIPKGPQRETLVLAGITLHPRSDLMRDLAGKYGNGRAPRYCPQRSWPEDDRKWPRELKELP